MEKLLMSFSFNPSLGRVSSEASEKFYPSDAPLLACSCLGIWIIYSLFDKHIESEKSKAWVIMLTSSFILSISGIYHVSKTVVENAWTLEAIYSENFFTRAVIIFFTSSNIMDLVLGVNHYPKYLDPLSTIMHHIFYIIFMLLLLSNHYSTGFQLCFVMEIPTFILAIGTVNKAYRSDVAFGSSFLLTRVLYNAFLAYKLAILSPEGLIWKTCVGVLGLHLYWFNKWIKVYGPKALALASSNEASTVQSAA